MNTEYAIRHIVGQRHVGESYRKVIRYVISRMRGGYKSFRSADRGQRRLLMELVIREHKNNRALYDQVMGGHLR